MLQHLSTSTHFSQSTNTTSLHPDQQRQFTNATTSLLTNNQELESSYSSAQATITTPLLETQVLGIAPLTSTIGISPRGETNSVLAPTHSELRYSSLLSDTPSLLTSPSPERSPSLVNRTLSEIPLPMRDQTAAEYGVTVLQHAVQLDPRRDFGSIIQGLQTDIHAARNSLHQATSVPIENRSSNVLATVSASPKASQSLSHQDEKPSSDSPELSNFPKTTQIPDSTSGIPTLIPRTTSPETSQGAVDAQVTAIKKPFICLPSPTKAILAASIGRTSAAVAQYWGATPQQVHYTNIASTIASCAIIHCSRKDTQNRTLGQFCAQLVLDSLCYKALDWLFPVKKEQDKADETAKN